MVLPSSLSKIFDFSIATSIQIGGVRVTCNAVGQIQVRCLFLGNEDLSVNYNQDPKLSFVINAIYTLAYALDNMHSDLCKDRHAGLCDAMKPVNGTLFYEYLLNVTFESPVSGDNISFNRNGDPPGRSGTSYDVIYYITVNNSQWRYQVG